MVLYINSSFHAEVMNPIRSSKSAELVQILPKLFHTEVMSQSRPKLSFQSLIQTNSISLMTAMKNIAWLSIDAIKFILLLPGMVQLIKSKLGGKF